MRCFRASRVHCTLSGSPPAFAARPTANRIDSEQNTERSPPVRATLANGTPIRCQSHSDAEKAAPRAAQTHSAFVRTRERANNALCCTVLHCTLLLSHWLLQRANEECVGVRAILVRCAALGLFSPREHRTRGPTASFMYCKLTVVLEEQLVLYAACRHSREVWCNNWTRSTDAQRMASATRVLESIGHQRPQFREVRLVSVPVSAVRLPQGEQSPGRPEQKAAPSYAKQVRHPYVRSAANHLTSDCDSPT